MAVELQYVVENCGLATFGRRGRCSHADEDTSYGNVMVTHTSFILLWDWTPLENSLKWLNALVKPTYNSVHRLFCFLRVKWDIQEEKTKRKSILMRHMSIYCMCPTAASISRTYISSFFCSIHHVKILQTPWTSRCLRFCWRIAV